MNVQNGRDERTAKRSNRPNFLHRGSLKCGVAQFRSR